MADSKQLPFSVPIYSTYHYHANAGVALMQNPDWYNWYLNNGTSLQCDRKFLFGYSSPMISVRGCTYKSIKELENSVASNRFTISCLPKIIKEMVDYDFYVAFSGVDDFYVKGKSWYNEKHFKHDGLICGYDENDETYTIAAYNSEWIYTSFKISQKDFYEGMSAYHSAGRYGSVVALKAKQTEIKLDINTIRGKLKEYLNSDFTIYPKDINAMAYGLVVHDYLSIYLQMLYSGEIPYEKADRRIFRMLAEHKKCMLDRICAVENEKKIELKLSEIYEPVYKTCECIRLLYAKYRIKQNNAILTYIIGQLTEIKNCEQRVLSQLLEYLESEDV